MAVIAGFDTQSMAPIIFSPQFLREGRAFTTICTPAEL